MPALTFESHGLSPQFLYSGEPGYFEAIPVGKVLFHVCWRQHKIEQLSFSYKSDGFSGDQTQQVRQTAVIDVLCLLVQGRARAAFAQLELREIENYLRERPEQPLWNPSLFNEMNQWFRELKTGLLSGLETILLGSGQYTKSRMEDAVSLSHTQWMASDMMTRVRWVEHHLDCFIRPILSADGGGIALIDVDDDSVVIALKGTCRQCRGGREGTMGFIQQFFLSLSRDSLKLKVVDEEQFLEAF